MEHPPEAIFIYVPSLKRARELKIMTVTQVMLLTSFRLIYDGTTSTADKSLGSIIMNHIVYMTVRLVDRPSIDFICKRYGISMKFAER